MNVLVLCRGKSLDKIHQIENDDFDLVLIVNEWSEQMKNEPFKSFLKGKKIIQYMCRSGPMLPTKEEHQEFNIPYCKLNILKEEYDKNTGMRRQLENQGINTKCMGEEMIGPSIDGKGGFPSTGVLAMVAAVVTYKATQVTVFGLDFFEAGYYTWHSLSRKSDVEHYQPKKGIVAKEFTKNYIKNNPEINFHLYTYADFGSKLDNLYTN